MTTFEPAHELVAWINTTLSSFNLTGLLKPQKYYKHIAYISARLNLASYNEKQVIRYIENYKVELPQDFYQYYSAFVISPYGEHIQYHQLPLTTFSRYDDVNCELITLTDNLEDTSVKLVQEKFTVNSGINIPEQRINRYKIQDPIQIDISKLFTPETIGIYSTSYNGLYSQGEVYFKYNPELPYIFSTHTDLYILLQYYANPFDIETELPLVPTDEILKRAVEDYIKYKVVEDLWLNNEAPDLERKYLALKANFDFSYKDARYLIKLPTFNSMINKVKSDQTKFSKFQL